MGFPGAPNSARPFLPYGDGHAPARRYARMARFTVGRGPVPRHAPVYQKIAGDRLRTTGQKKSAKDRPPPYAQNNVSRSLKVCKTLMSIAAQTQNALRSFRSLIGFARAARVFIKDLKDLENGTTRFSIDIKDLKDLKTSLDDGQREGQALALRARKKKMRGG